MANRKYYCFCSGGCKFETMTKEQILTAITQMATSGEIGDIDTGFVTTIRTINGTPLKFFVGNQYEYEALSAAERENLFAIITNDTTQDAFTEIIEELTKELSILQQTKANKFIAPQEIATKTLTKKGYYYFSATSDNIETSASSFGLVYWDGSKDVDIQCGNVKLKIWQDGTMMVFYDTVDMTENYQISAALVGEVSDTNDDSGTTPDSGTTTEKTNVMYYLTNVKDGDYPNTVDLGAPYYCEFYAKDGYELKEAYITFNGEDITNTKNADGSSRLTLVERGDDICCIVNIDAVMAVLGIEIIAQEVQVVETCNVTYNLSNVTTTGNAVATVKNGSSFSCGFNPADGYKITSYNVMHGEDDITSMKNPSGSDVCMVVDGADADVNLIVMVDNVSADMSITVTATEV